MPVGQPARQLLLASIPAAQVPSRMPPSGSTAGVQAEAETLRTAWWRVSVRVMATEYDSHRPRWASQAAKARVPPPESVRTSLPSPPVLFRRPGQTGSGTWPPGR